LICQYYILSVGFQSNGDLPLLLQSSPCTSIDTWAHRAATGPASVHRRPPLLCPPSTPHSRQSFRPPDQILEMQSSGRFSDGSLSVLGNPCPRPLHEAPHHAVFLRVQSGAPPPHRNWGLSERQDGPRKRDLGRGRRKLEEDGYGRFQRYGSLASAPFPQIQIV
jgi:hypothetical protein